MKTIIKKVDENNIEELVIEEAGAILKAGGLVAFPTETVYGLGANALDEEAAKKIYAAKGRPSDNPLIVHIAELQALEDITINLPPETAEIAARFWPGPLTMIFEKSDKIPYGTTGGLDTVAVRMPDDKIARALILAGGGYIAAPSANTSGRPSTTTAQHVFEDLDGKIDMILDGGAVSIGVESTILDMTVVPPMILRPGAITKDMLEKVLDEVVIEETQNEDGSDKPPKAPGMKYRHYAPKAQLIIVEGPQKEAVKAIKQIAYEQSRLGYKVGIIATGETVNRYTVGNIKNIGLRSNENSIAKNLYKVLREFDEEDTEYIYSEAFGCEGIGSAIMNRLLKAAGHHVLQAEDVTKLQQYRRILFVSSGDNCRGPMAAELLKKQPLLQEYEIGSRGLIVLFPEPANPKAEEVMKSQQMTLKNHEATLLVEDDLNEETLVLAMEESQKWKMIAEHKEVKHVYTLNEYIGVGNAIQSAYGKPLAAYRETYEMIKKFVELLASKLNEEAQKV
ncbi:MAG: L-threonylcarbamoyladenylate synthase [Lachnospiraceae bacterium]